MSMKAEEKGRKIPHRDRKNPTAREQWEKRKKEINAARGKLIVVGSTDDGDCLYEHIR